MPCVAAACLVFPLHAVCPRCMPCVPATWPVFPLYALCPRCMPGVPAACLVFPLHALCFRCMPCVFTFRSSLSSDLYLLCSFRYPLPASLAISLFSLSTATSLPAEFSVFTPPTAGMLITEHVRQVKLDREDRGDWQASLLQTTTGLSSSPPTTVVSQSCALITSCTLNGLVGPADEGRACSSILSAMCECTLVHGLRADALDSNLTGKHMYASPP